MLESHELLLLLIINNGKLFLFADFAVRIEKQNDNII